MLADAFTLTRFSIGLVFLVAAVSKLRQPSELERTLIALGVRRLGPLVVRLLIAFELGVAALALVGGSAGVVGLLLAAAALLAFAAVALPAVVRRLDVLCACFGTNETLSWYQVGRNVVLALWAGAVGLLAAAQPPAAGQIELARWALLVPFAVLITLAVTWGRTWMDLS